MTCPVCGSEDVRRSRKKTLLGYIMRWRGLQRYRCRECVKSFYLPLSPTDRPEGNRADDPPPKSRSERLAAHKRRQRRKIEFVVFFAMLVIFYAALKVLTHSS